MHVAPLCCGWCIEKKTERFFNAFFNPQVSDGSCILQVGSSIYIGLTKAFFPSYLYILMTLTMYLGPGNALGAMSWIGEDGRESWASFVSGVSS